MTANNKKIINHKDSANNLLLPPRNKYLPTSRDEINDLGWDQVVCRLRNSTHGWSQPRNVQTS